MPEDTRPRRALPTGEDDDPMDGYGDAAGDARTLGGGVDFFSSLGTERKKNAADKPDPEKVTFIFYATKGYVSIIILPAAQNQPHGAERRPQERRPPRHDR